MANISDTHMAAIVNGAVDAIISLDSTGIVLSWNTAAERMFGWAAEEIVGRPVQLLSPQARKSEQAVGLSKVLLGETVGKFATVRQRRDGVEALVAISMAPIMDGNGAVVGAAKFISGVPSADQALERFSESESRLRLLADMTPQLLWISDNRANLVWVNRRYCEYTGLTPEEACGWSWAKTIHPDHVNRVTDKVRRRADDESKMWEDTYPIKGRDGSYRWFLSRAHPLIDFQGVVSQMFGMNTDITEQLAREDHIRMLMGEVHHRAKNMIAVVQAMVNRTAPKDYAGALTDRLHALSRNLDLLTNSGWHGAPIGEVVRSQLAAVGDLLGARVRLDGALNLHLNRTAVETLGLAIHELATNAAKYGALSNDKGVVVIHCSVVEETRGKQLVVTWEERGGPPVVRPSREGYGAMIIARNPRLALSAEVALDYHDTGFRWRLCAPLETTSRELN